MTSEDFLVYLDSEIENQELNSTFEQFLLAIKLRILEEIGSKLGFDVSILPILASEDDLTVLKEKTLNYINNYDINGKRLFLQTLSMFITEMNKRYANVNFIYFTSSFISKFFNL